MTIYGLSGKSGTGKSYNAIEICSRRGIPALIDDGLFIYENTVLAGISAKKQPTKMGAIKTALFSNPEHAAEVSAAVRKEDPESLLIIGTSDQMVDRIAETLGLGPVEEHIHIEDVTSERQRMVAKAARRDSGMHTIPAPTFQLRKQFSGYFLDAKRAFRFLEHGASSGEEKTIVRPTYSYLGSYEISDKVISDIAEREIKHTPGASQLLWASSSNTDDGIFIRIIVLCEWGAKLRSTARTLQQRIHNSVAEMTAFNVLGVAVEIRGYKVKNL